MAIEYRSADGHYERLPALAADLVSRHVALMIAVGSTNSPQAARAATHRPFLRVTAANFRVVIKALHSDRAKNATAAELAAAERVVTGLRDVFVEEGR